MEAHGVQRRGEVTVADGRITLEAGNDLTGITYTGDVPRMGYEASLEATRLAGSDFFCGWTFPVGEEFVSFILGGWGGAVVGISSINDDNASENETTQFQKFETGKWCRVRVRVTPGLLEAWIDDEQMVKVATEGKRLAVRAGEIEASKPFGICSFRTRAALRNLQIRTV